MMQTSTKDETNEMMTFKNSRTAKLYDGLCDEYARVGDNSTK